MLAIRILPHSKFSSTKLRTASLCLCRKPSFVNAASAAKQFLATFGTRSFFTRPVKLSVPFWTRRDLRILPIRHLRKTWLRAALHLRKMGAFLVAAIFHTLFAKVSINVVGMNISIYSLASGSLTLMEKLLTTTPLLAWFRLSSQF